MEQLENIKNTSWEDMYKLAVIFYNHHGHSEIPQRFKTINGYEQDENGVNLGVWIARQRQYPDKLTDERRSKLKQINGCIINSVGE